MGKIKLYHVSDNLNEPLKKKFIPRIPRNARCREDETEARICFCDTIENCINAREDIKSENNNVRIIVWEKEFEKNDPYLIHWKELYEKSIVPDAALTHEYWYKKELMLEGCFYEIKNYVEAVANKKEYTLISHRYRDRIMDMLIEYHVDMVELEEMDLCYIVNKWIPLHFEEESPDICKRIDEIVKTIDDTDDKDDQIYEQIFGEKRRREYNLDKEIDYLFCGLKIEKVED